MKMVGGEMIIITFVFGFLVGSRASDCSLAEFQKLAKVKFHLQEGIFSSPFDSVSDMLKECQMLSKAISCAKTLLDRLPVENKAMFEVITGGKQKLSEEMCDTASETHRRFVDSFDCIKNVIKEAAECQEKFAMSQNLIKEEVQDQRDKVFYGCCAYEWRRECIVRVAAELCGQDTSSFVDNMVVTEVGEVQSKVCSSDVGSCHGRLYGVADGGRLEPSLVSWILLASLLWVNRLYRD